MFYERVKSYGVEIVMYWSVESNVCRLFFFLFDYCLILVLRVFESFCNFN